MKSLGVVGAFALAVAAVAATHSRRAPVAPYWAYVSHGGASQVDVYDLQTIAPFTQLAAVTVGAGPRGIAVADGLRRAYVVNSAGSTISVVDIRTMSVVNTITITNLNQSSEIVLSKDEQFFWVGGQDGPSIDGIVYKVSTATNTPVENILVGGINGTVFDLAFQDGAVPKVYATHPNNSVLAQIRYGAGVAADNTGKTEIALSGVNWVDVAPDGSRVYASTKPAPQSPAPVTMNAGDWSVTPPAPLAIAGVNAALIAGDFYEEIRFSSATPAMFAYIAEDMITNKFTPIDGTNDTGVGGTGALTTFNPFSVSVDPSSTLAFVGPRPGSGVTSVQVFDISALAVFAPAPFSNLSPVNEGWRVAFSTPNPPPQITNACPHGVNSAGGDVVTIEGANFVTGAAVRFAFGAGAVPSPMTTVVSSTEIRATAPASAAFERAGLLVDTPDGQTATLPAWVTYTGNLSNQSIAVTPGTTVTEYRKFSWPQITTWAAAKAALLATFGPYDPAAWRMFIWSPRQGAYLEFNEIPDTACDLTGQSFWILSRFGGTSAVGGLYSEVGQGTLTIALEPGWNMVSFPFDNGLGAPSNSGTWNNVGPNPVQLTDFTTFVPGYDTTPLNIFGDGRLIEWNGTSYGTVNLMEPGKGYWVFNKTSSVVYLQMLDPTFKAGTGTVEKSFTPLAPGSPEPPAPPGAAALGSDDSGPAQCSFGGRSAGDPLMALAFALLVAMALARALRS